MNRYIEFYKGMDDEEWEKFAVDIISRSGYGILTLPSRGIDGGKDFLVSDMQGNRCLVSCKHYIKSGKAIGTDIEQNIVDRMEQFQSVKFIGFYSTCISSSLQKRLDELCGNKGYSYEIFDGNRIATIIPFVDTHVLQVYGLYPNKYILNVPPENYRPLKCIKCGKDILDEKNISSSMVEVVTNNNKLQYLYGCKNCLPLGNTPWAELEQCLHLEWLMDWNEQVDFFVEISEEECDEDFFRNRYEFMQGVAQRQFPNTDGNWCDLSPNDFCF